MEWCSCCMTTTETITEDRGITGRFRFFLLFFRPPQSLKTASLPLSGVWQGWGPSLLSRRAHRPHTARSLLNVPGAALSAKASHSPSQAAMCGCRARGPGARSWLFAPSRSSFLAAGSSYLFQEILNSKGRSIGNYIYGQ